MKKHFLRYTLFFVFPALIWIGCNSTPENKATAAKDSTVQTPARQILDTTVITKDVQTAMTWQDALQRLKDGNERFVTGNAIKRDMMKTVKKTSEGQYPFAIILTCVDSRTSSELMFDQGIGDVFSARVAGNFVNTDILGSMEFACKVSGSKLIAVIGHSSCGAIKGACDNVQLGNLTSVIEQIKPAVNNVKDVPGDRNSKNHDFVEAVAKENVMITMQKIKDKSPVLKAMIDSGEIGLVGGMYDVATGKVTFY